MTKFIALAAVAAATLAATPAAAQGTDTGMIAPTGGRVEVLFGLDRPKTEGFKESGIFYGIGAGYDLAVNQTVSVGVDVEASDSTANFTVDTIPEVRIKAERDLYIGARLSYGLSDVANIYLKGGYTNTRFSATVVGIRERDNFGGFRVGAGGQYEVGTNAFVGGEYRYSNYEDGVSRHQLVATIGARF